MPQRCLSVACLKRTVMVWLGLLLAGFMAFILYDTYKYLSGHESYYSWWIDILGRLLILVDSYLLSGVWGCLPLPERCFLSIFTEPFLLWKFWTWGDQLRQLRHIDDQASVQENAYVPPSSCRFQITQPVPTYYFERRSVYTASDNVPEESLPLNPASCTSYGSARDNFVFPNFRDGPPKSNKQKSKCNQKKITKVRVEPIRNTSNGPNHPQTSWAPLRLGKRNAIPSDPIAINMQLGLLQETISERESVNTEKKKRKRKGRSQTKRRGRLPKKRLPSMRKSKIGYLRQLRENFAKRSKNKVIRDSAKPRTENSKQNLEVQIANSNQCEGASAEKFTKNLSRKEVYQDIRQSTAKCPGAREAVGNVPSGAQEAVGNVPSGAQEAVGNVPSGAQEAVWNVSTEAQAAEVIKHSET